MLLQGMAQAVPWWDNSYIYRRQITVAANSDVSSQMAVKFSFDAQSLVAAGKLRTDLKDLRIVHYDGTKNTEIDRLYFSDTKEIWFGLQSVILSGKTDNNYFVYYNSPNESTSAKAELSRIYPSVSGIFTRSSIASYETGGSVQDVSNYSVPRFLTSKFGKGLYIEEGITNYLYNSSFEYYDEPSEVPYYWVRGAGIATAELLSSEKIHGNFSMHIIDSSALNGSEYMYFNTRLTASYFAGKQLTFSAWIKQVGVTATAGGSQTVGISIYAKKSTTLYTTTTLISSAVLSTSITAGDTTIPVTSTAGFVTPTTVAYIKIDSEKISYTGVTPTSFTGCTRAQLSTSAAAHSASAIVYYHIGTVVQTPIAVVSTAGFPGTGYIRIDSEILQYTGVTPTSFTGCTRGTASEHTASTLVYYYIGSTGTSNVSVASTIGFLSAGYIYIDSEVLQYTSITPTSFINCTRGALSTTAAVHVGGTAVYSNDVNNDTLVYTNNNTALNWKRYVVTQQMPEINLYDLQVRIYSYDNDASTSGGPTSEFYVDSAQLEVSSVPTTYTSTPAGSSDLRAFERLSYAMQNNIKESVGTISLWIRTPDTSTNSPETPWSIDQKEHRFFDTGKFALYKNTSNQIVFTDGANTINSTAITWVTTTDHNIIATWGSGLKLYIDGSLVASTSNFTQPSLSGNMFIGSSAETTKHVNAIISDIAIYNRELSTSEITTLYNKTTSPLYWPDAIFFATLSDSVNGYGETAILLTNITMSGESPQSSEGTVIATGVSGEVTYTDDSLTKITVPAYVYNRSVKFRISLVDNPEKGNNSKLTPAIAYDFRALDPTTDKELNITRPVGIYVHYKSTNGNVYDTFNNLICSVNEVKTKLTLGFWTGIFWQPVSGTVEISGNDITISTKTSRFGIYGVLAKESTVSGLSVTPNPFTPYGSNSLYNKVTFAFSNDANENVEVKIWDITGTLVKTIDGGVSNAIPWYGTNEKEEAVESGVYIYQVKAGNSIIGKGTIIVAK